MKNIGLIALLSALGVAVPPMGRTGLPTVGLAAGQSHSVVLSRDGAVWLVGAVPGVANPEALEDGSLDGLEGVASLAGGGAHALILKVD
jgi:hypothetical protein